jgi:hypothetical protein
MMDAPGYTGVQQVARRSSGSPPPPKRRKPSEVSTDALDRLRELQKQAAENLRQQAELMEEIQGEPRVKPTKSLVHPAGSTTCQVCAKTFKSHPRLLRHVNVAHLGEGRHVCSTCDRSFASAFYLRSHVKSCTGGVRSEPAEPRFVCTICSEEFLHAWELAQHVKTHPKGGSWSCPFSGCNKSYKTEASMRSHRSGCSKAPGFVRKECLFCDRQYARLSDLNTHMKVDHGFGGGRGQGQKK